MSINDQINEPQFTVIDALNYIIGLYEILIDGDCTIIQRAKIKHEILIWQKIIRYLKQLHDNSNGINYYRQKITKENINDALNNQCIDNYFLQKQVLKYYEY